MSLKKKYILAIEAAIEGGSLSVWRNGAEVAAWNGTNAVSKAEDLLAGLAVLLEINGFQSEEFQAVAAATEAGSATGLKIGLATAQGLAKALQCELRRISTWNALANHLSKFRTATVLLPYGKNRVGQRHFENGRFAPDIQIFTAVGTVRDANRQAPPIFAHRLIAAQMNFTKEQSAVDLGDNFAFYIGKFAAQYASDNELTK